MMKRFIFLLVLLFPGCSPQIVETQNVESITIEDVNTGQSIDIVSHSQIDQLMKCVNRSRKTIAIIPKGWFCITVTYTNKEQKTILLADKKYLKYYGASYKTTNKIYKIIGSFFDGSDDIDSKKDSLNKTN